MITLGVVGICSYLLGSVSPSILIAGLARGIDIRDYGSGNAGATNVLRVMGWKPALIVLLLDAAKGFVAAWLIARLRLGDVPWSPESVQAFAGMCAVLGHIWPLFARFRGGKGVATGAGVILAIQPVLFLVCALVFVAVVLPTGYVSLGSICAAVAFPTSLVVLRVVSDRPVAVGLIALVVVVAALVVFAHRSNIANLVRGKEHRFSRPRRR